VLTPEDLTLLRRQLGEQQTLVRETLDRLTQVQEENEHIARRRDELEQRLQTLESEYEELLGVCHRTPSSARSHAIVEKTIHDEENSNLDLADSMTELKVKRNPTARGSAAVPDSCLVKRPSSKLNIKRNSKLK